MSRQAKVTTEIQVKDPAMLDQAVRLACAEIGGTIVDRVRYYSGKVLGIRHGHIEIGVVIEKNGTISFVGEDVYLHSEIGRRIKNLVLKSLSSLGVAKALTKMGYQVTVKRAQKNQVRGVQA